MEAVVSASAELAGAAQKAAEAAAVTAGRALEKHSKAVAAAVKKDKKTLGAAADKEAKACSAAGGAASTARLALQGELEASLEADQAAAAVLLASTAAGQQGVVSLASTQQAGMAAVSSAVCDAVDKRYRTDAERGAVPAQRERAVPTRSAVDALCAPPEEGLLAEFRASQGGHALHERETSGAAEQDAEPTIDVDENENPSLLGEHDMNACSGELHC